MSRNLLLAFTLTLLGAVPAWAQSAATSELYGEGVHRYFAHDYQGADQLLTEAIEKGSQDPRAYYFRGLAREMMGGGGELDFEQGARVEASGRSGPMIGYSLARVQGHVRSKLEKARRAARILAAEQLALQRQAAPAVVPPALPPATGAADPFQGEGTRSQDTQAAPPAAQPPAAGDASTDPFGDEPKPDSTDPFGGATEPADPFGGDTKPAEPADPFGGASGDDPFK